MATPSLIQYRTGTLAFDPGNTSQTQTSYTLPLFNATTNGNLIIVIVGHGTFTATGFAVTNEATSDTFVSQQVTTDTPNGTTLRMFTSISGGGKRAHTITFTGGTANNTWMAVYEFSNVSSATADVTGGHVGAASTTISGTSANITPTQTGDLLFQYMSETTQFTTASFTAGSHANITWTLLHSDLNLGTASQWGQYNSTTALTPQFTQGTSQAYVSIAAAFKTGASGGDLAAGVRVRGVASNNTLHGQTSPVSIQMPIVGNTIAIQYSAINTFAISSISDGTNTYTQIGSQVVNNAQGAQAFYAKNVTPGNYTLSFTMSSSGGGTNAATFMIYDISGASTTAPLDTAIGTSGQAKNTGCSSPSGNCSSGGTDITLTLTPSVTNELILVHASTAADTETGFSVGSPSGAAFIAANWLDGGANTQINPTLADENDLWGGGYAPNTSSQTWGSTHDTRNSAGTGNWSILGFGILAPAAVSAVFEDDSWLSATQFSTPVILSVSSMFAYQNDQDLAGPLFGQPDEDYWSVFLIQPLVPVINVFS